MQIALSRFALQKSAIECRSQFAHALPDTGSNDATTAASSLHYLGLAHGNPCATHYQAFLVRQIVKLR